MSVSNKIFYLIFFATGPILAYIYMKTVKANVKIFLETKVIDKGIYKKNPVYGDKVIPIARSMERIATITFVFTIMMSALFWWILYINW